MMREIAYSKQGDYLLPDITVPDEPETHVGKYGSLRRNYLKEQHYGIFLSLLTQGKYVGWEDWQTHLTKPNPHGAMNTLS